ncbi:Scr1 family TA system antitoxin-like transcriptional regulator [Streptomyces sp. NPDC047009]|uniref:Scr1 family TA system antitoxin-like transcriptional regulator n=1 Tax=Streptomyces sp. NPDC047009 TaxID=3154496 RepID=UPI0033ECFE75
MERSRIIHEPGHRFAMVIEEPVLHYRLGDPDAMAAYLGYLLTAGVLPQVSLGIIPSAVQERPIWPQEVFHVYDEALVSVELLAARVQVTQPSEIALYGVRRNAPTSGFRAWRCIGTRGRQRPFPTLRTSTPRLCLPVRASNRGGPLAATAGHFVRARGSAAELHRFADRQGCGPIRWECPIPPSRPP